MLIESYGMIDLLEVAQELEDELGVSYDRLSTNEYMFIIRDNEFRLEIYQDDIVWHPLSAEFSRLYLSDYDSVSDFIEDISWEVK